MIAPIAPFILLTLALLAPSLHAQAPAQAEVPSVRATGALTDSVVKVFSTSRAPDTFKPWTKQSPQESTGSGVVIDGKRIFLIK